MVPQVGTLLGLLEVTLEELELPDELSAIYTA
jgi:hypothetical protein